jgi:dynein assembly factor 2
MCWFGWIAGDVCMGLRGVGEGGGGSRPGGGLGGPRQEAGRGPGPAAGEAVEGVWVVQTGLGSIRVGHMPRVLVAGSHMCGTFGRIGRERGGEGRGRRHKGRGWPMLMLVLSLLLLSIRQELVVRVSLPGVTSSATLELEVTATGVHLVLPEKFTLDLPLPHTVDSHKGTAKFDPVKAQLTLTLPVVRPPAKGEGSPTAAAAAGAVGLSVDDSQAAPGAAAGEDATSGDAALQQSAAVTHPTTATAAAGGAPAPTAATATAAAEWPGTPEPHAVAPQPSLSTTSSSSTGTTTSSSGSSSRDEPEGPAAAGPAPAAGGAAAGGPVKTPTQLAWEALHAQQTTNHAATSSSCAAAPAAAGVEAAGGVDGGTGAQQGGSTAGAKHGAATATTTTTTAPQRAAAAAAAAAAATALAAAGLGGHHLPAAAAATGSSGPSSCQTSSTGSGSAVAGTAAGVRLPPRLLGARRLAAALD